MGGDKIMYALSALCIILGFVALLKQKNYIDSNTNQPTEIDLPIVGKLKTNYPALAFVVFGAILAIFALKTMSSGETGKKDIVITGTFLAPPNKTVTWEKGQMKPLPKGLDCSTDRSGNFEITGSIPNDKIFEDLYSSIIYTNGSVSKEIVVLEGALPVF